MTDLERLGIPNQIDEDGSPSRGSAAPKRYGLPPFVDEIPDGATSRPPVRHQPRDCRGRASCCSKTLGSHTVARGHRSFVVFITWTLLITPKMIASSFDVSLHFDRRLI